MKFKLLPGLWLTLVLVAGMVSCNPAPEKTNVLFILADDVGREVIGSYGGTSYKTSNIDALAERGMQFGHVYASPVCHPTRVTLLTGRYPFQLGDPDWGSFPAEAETETFAHEFKKAGYATAAAGKWQLATLGNDPDHPHRLGFDEYSFFGWHEGPRYHQPMIYQNGNVRKDVGELYGPDVYCDFLIDFMKRNRKGPFFAYYPMALIHDVSDDLEVPPAYGPNDRYENVEEMITEMDRIVGKLMKALVDMDLDQNTLVVFTTDNGTNHKSIIRHENGEYIDETVYSEINGMMIPGGKKYFNDWGVRVPTMMVWPEKISEGSECNELIDFSDFMPTLLDMLDLPAVDYKISGRSFSDGVKSLEYPARDWVFSQKKLGDGHMVRTEDWKLLWDERLYNMKTDPLESSPILPDEDTEESAGARNQLDSILTQIFPPH